MQTDGENSPLWTYRSKNALVGPGWLILKAIGDGCGVLENDLYMVMKDFSIHLSRFSIYHLPRIRFNDVLRSFMMLLDFFC